VLVWALGGLVRDAPGVRLRVARRPVDPNPRAPRAARAVEGKLVPLAAESPAVSHERCDYAVDVLMQFSSDAPQVNEISLRHMSSEQPNRLSASTGSA
jgi:hypothetical protein